jgi:iron complex outermembrane receptor protein
MNTRGKPLAVGPCLGLGLIVLATTLPRPAIAQDAASDTRGRIEEIVVTAQRREERLLDVPISVTSNTVAQLDQAAVDGLFDLSNVVPGLRVDHYGAYAQPTIRGVGTQDVLGPGANANVAIYIDGFYMPSQTGNLFEFANVQRVDVLKGPQGTLFGQNATGGAILITTRDPQFESTGRIRLGFGSFDEVNASIYGTTGLTDSVAMDWSLYYRDSDGYLEDIATGNPTAPPHYEAFRTKFLYAPNDRTRWTLALEYLDIDDATGLGENTRDPIAQIYNDSFGVPIVATLEPYKTSFNYQASANPVTMAAMLTGDMQFGDLDFKSNTQYRDQDAEIRADLDGTTIQYWQTEYDETEETFTQEFNIGQAGTGRLDWVAGLFYYYDKGFLRNNAYNDFFNTGTRTSWLSSDATVTTRSVAAFADGAYAISDTWWLTLGGRYTSEEKSLHTVGLLAPFTEYRDSHRWDEFTPRIVLRHELTENSNIYGSISRGFMSGNYAYASVGPQQPVDPELITQYEIGFKSGGGHWTFDTAAYYSDYEDLQVFLFDNNCACFQLDNAPKAEIYGLEAHVSYELSEHLTLNLAGAYTHARYKEYLGVGITGDPVIPPNYGYATAPADFSGRQMLRTPDYTASIAFNYLRPIGSGSVNLSGNYYYTDDVPLTPGNEYYQDAYGLLNIRAGWISEDEKWSIYGYGTNVTDEEYLIFSTAGFLGNNYIYGAPVAWGLQVDFNY